MSLTDINQVEPLGRGEAHGSPPTALVPSKASTSTAAHFKQIGLRQSVMAQMDKSENYEPMPEDVNATFCNLKPSDGTVKTD